jgi:hypothetical protein
LVAYEPPSSEHLGIRLVAAGLVAAGFRPRVLPLVTPSQLEATVRETLAAQPFLVGASVTDPLVAPLLLAFVRLLRVRGYAGHITVGGALATLERGNLLATHPAVDSVVRHAGEVSIVELAHALSAGHSLDDVSGLTTRMGEGKGNPHAFMPSQLWPLRAAEPPTLLGIPKAAVAASRGCAGRCAYCGIAALESDLAKERGLLGLGSGPRGAIQRPVDDLADEVGALYHERAVRVFQLVDDNLLGSDPRVARAWLGDLEAALRKRQVGKLAWRLMVEPRALSEDVADALARLGALSVLVGIESLTPQGKSALGRRSRSDADLIALRRLARRGIDPTFNVLAIRPDETLADTGAELAGLSEIDDFAWDVVPLAVWPGTTLARDLAAKGMLVGQGAGLAWRPVEPESERFLFALNRLRLGGLAWLTRQANPVDVMFALRVAQRLGLPGATSERIEQASLLLAQVQRMRRSILDQALALAMAKLSAREYGQAVEALAGQAGNRLSPFDERFASLLDDVRWPGTHAGAARPARRLASPWLAHGLLMAMTAGCGSASSGKHDANPPIVQLPDAGGSLVMPDAPSEAKPDTQPIPLDTSCGLDGAQTSLADGSCESYTLQEAVRPYTCGTALITRWDQPGLYHQPGLYAVMIDCEGRAVELLNMEDQTPLLSGDARQAWLDSVANDRWPCLAGQTIQFMCYVSMILTP